MGNASEEINLWTKYGELTANEELHNLIQRNPKIHKLIEPSWLSYDKVSKLYFYQARWELIEKIRDNMHEHNMRIRDASYLTIVNYLFNDKL